MTAVCTTFAVMYHNLATLVPDELSQIHPCLTGSGFTGRIMGRAQVYVRWCQALHQALLVPSRSEASLGSASGSPQGVFNIIMDRQTVSLLSELPKEQS